MGESRRIGSGRPPKAPSESPWSPADPAQRGDAVAPG